MILWLMNLGFGGSSVETPENSFGLISTIKPGGDGAISAISATGQGVTSQIFESFGIISTIKPGGDGAISAIDPTGQGVESDL